MLATREPYKKETPGSNPVHVRVVDASVIIKVNQPLDCTKHSLDSEHSQLKSV